MTSRYEVLEYLRYHRYPRKVAFRKLKDFFDHKGTSGTGEQVRRLVKQGYVKKYVKEIIPTKSPVEDDIERFIPKTDEPPIYYVYLELTDQAFELLEKYNVDSFYELPRAKMVEREMKNRSNSKYQRNFVDLSKYFTE